MRPDEPGADDTIRIVPVKAAQRPRGPILAGAVIAGMLLLGGSLAGWWFWPQPTPAPAPLQIQIPEPARAPAPAERPAPFAIETATERQIRDHVATGLTIFQLAANPQILVLDFAALRQQGRMLNRVAALVEKSGLPHDRVLTDSELDEAIRAQGDTVETFYYGHDYSAAALARFFTLADAAHVPLNAQEERLRALLTQQGWLAPGVIAGLISIPAVGANEQITAEARAAILHHELAHGEFFSNPTYADFVAHFWFNELTAIERTEIRRFLASQQYDASLEELMYNEMQAYLIFTHDRLFFTPAMVGLTPARLAELQTRFRAGMPQGWLRDTLNSERDPKG